MPVQAYSEWDSLQQVIVGRLGNTDRFGVDNNISIRYHYRNGDVPRGPDDSNWKDYLDYVRNELNSFIQKLEERDIEVMRPKRLPAEKGQGTQIFARDIGIAIGDQFVKGHTIAERSHEYVAIEDIVHSNVNREKIIDPCDYQFEWEDASDRVLSADGELHIEGGDVVQHGDTVFLGVGTRTTPHHAKSFLESHIPDRDIVQVPLRYSSFNIEALSEDELEKAYLTNVLHLDCMFQPIGPDCALLWEEGVSQDETWWFADENGRVKDHSFDVSAARSRFFEKVQKLFPEDRLIVIDSEDPEEQEARASLCTNVLAIGQSKVISSPQFSQLNKKIRKRGFEVIEVDYEHIARLGGLFRCSTLPLRRDRS